MISSPPLCLKTWKPARNCLSTRRPAESNTASGSVSFGEDTPLDPGTLILMLQKNARSMRFDGPKKLRFTGKFEEPEQRFAAAQRLLEDLGRCVTRH